MTCLDGTLVYLSSYFSEKISEARPRKGCVFLRWLRPIAARSALVSLLCLYCFIMTLIWSVTEAAVVINEVYYDAEGPDSGKEFIELINNREATVITAGSTIDFIDGRNGSSVSFYIFHEDIIIEKNGFLLVVGTGWGDGFQHTGRCVLQNGPDAVRFRPVGSDPDLVGYGELNIPGACEAAPAPDAPSGFSISRRPDGNDTDNNSQDFIVAEPSPGKRNFFDKNMSLTIRNGDLFPCGGYPVKIALTLSNIGLSELGGPFSIGITTGYPPGCVDFQRIIDCQYLKPGEEYEASFLVDTPAGADSGRVIAFFLDEEDQFSKDDQDTVSFFFSPYRVVVNEIMYRPIDGGSEWVEILNRGISTIDLKGWGISDASSGVRMISNSRLEVPPGGYLILAQYPERLVPIFSKRDEQPAVHGIEGGWPPLNDHTDGSFSEKVILTDHAGRIAERVLYKALSGEERERSLERYSPSSCSTSGENLWHRCYHHSGSTPGTVNSVYNGQRAISSSLRIEPNPFSPSRDGEVIISGKLEVDEGGYLIRIYSIEGVQIAKLMGGVYCARHFSCRWNGSDSRGNVVTTGLYVCAIEYFGRSGYVCRVEKVCLAVHGD